MRRKTLAFDIHTHSLHIQCASEHTDTRTHALIICRSIHLHALNNLATHTSFLPFLGILLSSSSPPLIFSRANFPIYINLVGSLGALSKIYSSVTLLNIAGDQSSSRSLNYRIKGPGDFCTKGNEREENNEN